MIVFAASRACLPNIRRRSMAHLTAPDCAFLYASSVREHSMSNAVILTDISGGIGTITLNKPWKLNAWDTSMRAEITAILNNWNRDPAVRAVIMTGAGERAFCAGQDLEETEKFQSGHEGANWFQSWQDFYNAIRGLDKPCLAALNGVAAAPPFRPGQRPARPEGRPAGRRGRRAINAGIPRRPGPC